MKHKVNLMGLLPSSKKLSEKINKNPLKYGPLITKSIEKVLKSGSMYFPPPPYTLGKTLSEQPSTARKTDLSGYIELHFRPFSTRNLLQGMLIALGEAARQEEKYILWLFEGLKLGFSAEQGYAWSSLLKLESLETKYFREGLHNVWNSLTLSTKKAFMGHNLLIAEFIKELFSRTHSDIQWVLQSLDILRKTPELSEHPNLLEIKASCFPILQIVKTKWDTQLTSKEEEQLRKDLEIQKGPLPFFSLVVLFYAKRLGEADIPFLEKRAETLHFGGELCLQILSNLPSPISREFYETLQNQSKGDLPHNLRLSISNLMRNYEAQQRAKDWPYSLVPEGKTKQLTLPFSGGYLKQAYFYEKEWWIPYQQILWHQNDSTWQNNKDQFGILRCVPQQNALDDFMIPCEFPPKSNGASGSKRQLSDVYCAQSPKGPGLLYSISSPFYRESWGTENFLFFFSWQKKKWFPVALSEKKEIQILESEPCEESPNRAICFGELQVTFSQGKIALAEDRTPYHLDDYSVVVEQITEQEGWSLLQEIPSQKIHIENQITTFSWND